MYVSRCLLTFGWVPSLIENMTGCSWGGMMDAAVGLRKPLALLESLPVRQSMHTALCVCKQTSTATFL